MTLGEFQICARLAYFRASVLLEVDNYFDSGGERGI